MSAVATHLKQVTEVDEHMGGLLHSASHVKAGRDDILRATTLHKAIRNSEREDASCTFRNAVWKSKCACQLLDPSLAYKLYEYMPESIVLRASRTFVDRLLS